MSSALLIGAEGLVALLESGLDRVLLIDSRPFVEYNTCHILEAVNVNCSKLMKRRLQQDKIQITELLQHSAKRKLEIQGHVVVYDQSSHDPTCLSSEAFLSILLAKLEKSFPSVHLLSGGFVEFSHLFPGLCEGKSTQIPCISQPCLPVTYIGPTQILPHLYLGCQRDVLNKELMQQNDITYVLNASNTCPKPDFISETHFLRVPVNDSFCEKILPWLDRSVDFIEKAKASNGRVLVHCLAGISRSATIAIAYIMKRMDMTLDEAYRFVKEKRPTISPNFNFLGQLLDFEKKLKRVSEAKPLQEDLNPEGSGLSEPVTGIADHHLLTRRLCCLRLEEELEDTVRPKRSFSLDIKLHGESGASLRHPVSGDAPERPEHDKPPSYKDSSSKPCQCSPVQEVSEQSPDKGRAEESSAGRRAVADKPSSPQTVSEKLSAVESCPQPLHRSGSMEETPSGFVFGLTRSQQPSCKADVAALKGWHSDILLAPLAGGWYLSSELGRFYSTSAIFGGTSGTPSGLASAYGHAQDPKAVRRRGRQRGGDCGDSRRSWHEESSFEKQLKRRSCQMEFEDGMTENGSREEMAKMGSQSSFSGSMEIIEVS